MPTREQVVLIPGQLLLIAGGGSNFQLSVNYVETCSNGQTYNLSTTCPYGECDCEGTMDTVPYDCDSGVSGAFAACGYPQ